jgi:hypothetical protein
MTTTTASDVLDPVIPGEDPEVAQARFLVQQQITEPVDVLIFGESTLTFTGPSEPGALSVADLIAEKLSSLRTYLVAGPGYGPAVHREFVRMATSLPARPTVVHTLFVRGTLPAFYVHPVYGYRRGVGRLASLHADDAFHTSIPAVPPTPEEWLRYEQLPYPTVRADRTIADFMRALRDNLQPGDPEFLQWLFEFHYGGTPSPEALAAYTDIGRLLSSTGCPVVAVQNPVNIRQGVHELGPQFRQWHARNERAVLDAYRSGAGAHAQVLMTSDLWDPSDFIDPALEHLTLEARDRLASTVAAAVLKAVVVSES